MKKVLSIILILLTFSFVLIGCNKTEYSRLEKVNHAVVEPDDKAKMDATDKNIYSNLVEAMLKGEDEISLSSDKDKNLYYLDLLKQSPYYFLVSDEELTDNSVKFTYSYPYEKQEEIVHFMDKEILEMVNYNREESDNQLDVVLKIYAYVTSNISYDKTRTDNKTLKSTRFVYPHDEIYLALKNKKSLCFGYAYLIRFAYLQYDIDTFCVYGLCKAHQQGHMWNVFKYNDKFYNCDAAWDRTDEGYSKLYHFGKTDNERRVDTLELEDFSTYHDKAYGKVVCNDEKFKKYRGMSRFYNLGEHKFFLSNDKNEYIFNTEKFTIKRS